MATQRLALTKLAARTWGPGLFKARQAYTMVVRAALAYGATAFHTPTPIGAKPVGPVRHLAREQNRCLLTVTGAYKATAIRNLETEAAVPPFDLYLNKRLADFEVRLAQSGLDEVIDGARLRSSGGSADTNAGAAGGCSNLAKQTSSSPPPQLSTKRRRQ